MGFAIASIGGDSICLRRRPDGLGDSLGSYYFFEDPGGVVCQLVVRVTLIYTFLRWIERTICLLG